jgi:hypothetical protein
MVQPQIVLEDWQGKHNKDPYAADRLIKGSTYKDVSTVIVIPTRGVIPAKVVQCWWNLMMPMNQKAMRMFVIGMEVGQAYNAAVETILSNPELCKWKYMLTLEEDNMPPPDGLLKLYEGMEKFDVVSGLYWTKGEGGQPMIYGDPSIMPKNFIPQIPKPDQLQACNGLGMGFDLFKIDIFKKVPKPWFKTVQQYNPGQGSQCFTQDLWFFQEAAKWGFKFACDTRVKTGHFDLDNDIIW